MDFVVQRSGLNLYWSFLKALSQGALRCAYSKLVLHKNKSFFDARGYPKEPPGVTHGYCTRAIGAPVATVVDRSNPDAICH
jgi:hypothetical protein